MPIHDTSRGRKNVAKVVAKHMQREVGEGQRGGYASAIGAEREEALAQPRVAAAAALEGAVAAELAGTTVLMVTHEPDMAAYARTIVHFRDGLIEHVATGAAAPAAVA